MTALPRACAWRHSQPNTLPAAAVCSHLLPSPPKPREEDWGRKLRQLVQSSHAMRAALRSHEGHQLPSSAAQQQQQHQHPAHALRRPAPPAPSPAALLHPRALLCRWSWREVLAPPAVPVEEVAPKPNTSSTWRWRQILTERPDEEAFDEEARTSASASPSDGSGSAGGQAVWRWRNTMQEEPEPEAASSTSSSGSGSGSSGPQGASSPAKPAAREWKGEVLYSFADLKVRMGALGWGRGRPEGWLWHPHTQTYHPHPPTHTHTHTHTHTQEDEMLMPAITPVSIFYGIMVRGERGGVS